MRSRWNGMTIGILLPLSLVLGGRLWALRSAPSPGAAPLFDTRPSPLSAHDDRMPPGLPAAPGGPGWRDLTPTFVRAGLWPWEGVTLLAMQGPKAATAQGRISVVVFRADTNSPVVEATVTLTQGSASWSLPTLSEGIATFPPLTEGSYTMTATGPGLLPSPRTAVRVTGNTLTGISVYLRPCGSTALTPGNLTGSLSEGSCNAPHRPASKADLYTFAGTARQVVTITMLFTSPSSFPAAYLTVVDPSGVVIGRDGGSGVDGSAVIRDVTLPRTGTYLIEATASSAGVTGSYRLTLEVSPPICPATPAPGSTLVISQSRPRAGDRITFIVVGRPGETAAVAFSRSDSGAVYRGEPLALGPDLGVLFMCRLPDAGQCSQSFLIPGSTSGTYYFQAARSSDPSIATGTFSLTTGACLTIQ